MHFRQLAPHLPLLYPWDIVDLNAVIHRRWSGLLGTPTAVRSVGARRALTVTALCVECSSILLGCRSTDPQASVEPTTDQEPTEKEIPASPEPSAPPEEPAPPADLGAYYDGPVSPEGYRLLEEKDRRDPPQGHATVPDLPAEEKERVERTLATMKAFSGELEKVHSLDYCRAAKETAPTDAWGSKVVVFCSAKFRGLALVSTGPDRIDGSKDDVRWGFSIRKQKMDDSWTINRDVWD